MTGSRNFLQGAMGPQTQDDKIAQAVYMLGFTPYNGVVDMLKIRANPDTGYIKIGNRFYTYNSRTTNPSKLESVLGPLQQGKTDYSSLNDPGSVLKPPEPSKSQMADAELQRNLYQSAKKGENIDREGTLNAWMGQVPRTRIQELLRSVGVPEPTGGGGGMPGQGTRFPTQTIGPASAPPAPTQLDFLHKSMQQATPPTNTDELLRLLLQRYWGPGGGY